jgi:esterase/lipase
MFEIKWPGMLFTLICIGIGAGCATVNSMKISEKKPASYHIWTESPKSSPTKAVVIILHGLNLKPEKMDSWARLMAEHGAYVVRCALSGHAFESIKEMSQVRASAWQQEMKKAGEIAEELAKKEKLPIYFLAFSLGALVGLDYLARLELSGPLFEKMVLIAPALAIPWYSRFAINTLGLFSKTLILPSRSPAPYRAQRGTSIAAYQALFAIKDSLEKAHYRNSNQKTLVLIDKHDELVPMAALKKIIAQERLSQWKLEIVNNRFAFDNYGFRHLMIDEEAIGMDLWTDLSSRVLKHFGF